MFSCCIACLVVRHPQQCQFDLQRCRTNKASELVFGRDLLGHQIQQRDTQGADILQCRLIFVHDANALTGENIIGGQCGWNLDRHLISSSTGGCHR